MGREREGSAWTSVWLYSYVMSQSALAMNVPSNQPSTHACVCACLRVNMPLHALSVVSLPCFLPLV